MDTRVLVTRSIFTTPQRVGTCGIPSMLVSLLALGTAHGADSLDPKLKRLSEWLPQRTIEVAVESPDSSKCNGTLMLPREYTGIGDVKVRTLYVLREGALGGVARQLKAHIEIAPASGTSSNRVLAVELTFEGMPTDRAGDYIVDLELIPTAGEGCGSTLKCRVPRAEFEPIDPIIIEQKTCFAGSVSIGDFVWQEPALQLLGPHRHVPVRFKISKLPTNGDRRVPGAIEPGFLSASHSVAAQDPAILTTHAVPIEPRITQPFTLGQSSGQMRFATPYGAIDVPFTVMARDVWWMIPLWIVCGLGAGILLRVLLPSIRGRLNVAESQEQLLQDLSAAKHNRSNLPFIEDIDDLCVRTKVLSEARLSQEDKAKSTEQRRIIVLNALRAELDKKVEAFEARRQALGQKLEHLANGARSLERFGPRLRIDVEWFQTELEASRKQRDEGQLDGLDASLSEIAGRIDRVIRDRFEARRNVLSTHLLKPGLPALGFLCPADVKTRWIQGVDHIIEAWAAAPKEGADAATWATFLDSSEALLQGAILRLPRDLGSKMENVISDLGLWEGDALRQQIDRADGAVKEIAQDKCRQIVLSPAGPDQIDSVIWQPLAKALKAVWQLLDAAAEQAKVEAGTYLPLRSAGDMDGAVRQIMTPPKEEPKKLFTTMGLESAADGKALGGMVRPHALSLPPIQFPLSAQRAADAADKHSFRLPWGAGRFSIADKRRYIQWLETSALAALALFAGTLLFAPAFVGDLKDVSTLFVWGFGLDLSFAGILTQARRQA